MTELPTDTTPLLLLGDVILKLASLPPKSVHCVVTSPPYLGLRRYDICECAQDYDRKSADHFPVGAKDGSRSSTRVQRKPPDPNCEWCHGSGILPGLERVWGGAPGHDHAWSTTKPIRSRTPNDQGATSWLQGPNLGSNYDAKGGKACACGAWLGCLGNEPTPELYVEHVVDVIEALRPVLRDDGTLWLNLGDTYSTHKAGKTGGNRGPASWMNGDGAGAAQAAAIDKRYPGYKEKDQLLIPHRVAMELQRRGWWVRRTVTWCKPNPMREGVKDRPTAATEFIFLLTKSKRYFYDPFAELQPFAASTLKELETAYRGEGLKAYEANGVQNPSDTKRRIIERLRERGGSYLLDWWVMKVRGYKGAHFATFPPELPKRCIKLGTSQEGVCPECGAPFVRQVQTQQHAIRTTSKRGEPKQAALSAQGVRPRAFAQANTIAVRETQGWAPTCQCGKPPVPALVLDIFLGSGTTCAMARELGRRSIGIEVNPQYLVQAQRRCKVEHPTMDRFVKQEVATA